MPSKPKDHTKVLRALAMALPGVTEGTLYGTLAFLVGGKSFARLREDGESLVVRVGPIDKEFLLAAEPDFFYTTDHYNGYPSILVRLAKVPKPILRERLIESWRQMAPKKLLAQHPDLG